MPKKKDPNEVYFGKKEEDAVDNYISSKDFQERNKIYNEFLKDPLIKMVKSIIRKYPIHIGNYDILEVEQNALTHVASQIDKFKRNKKTKTGEIPKAYSYFGTIARNFLKTHSVKSRKEIVRDLCFEDFSEEFESNRNLSYELDIEQVNPMVQLFKTIIVDLKEELLTNKTLKVTEIKVGEAIVNVLENWEVLFSEDSEMGNYNKKVTNNYTKNKVLFFLKEQTKLSTKEIRQSMVQFKNLYFLSKLEFFNEEDK